MCTVLFCNVGRFQTTAAANCMFSSFVLTAAKRPLPLSVWRVISLLAVSAIEIRPGLATGKE